jgi:hypothetical protein
MHTHGLCAPRHFDGAWKPIPPVIFGTGGVDIIQRL